MDPIYIVLIVIISLILIFFLTCYICFRLAFFVPNSKKMPKEDDMPPGKIYEPYYAQMRAWNKETKALPKESLCITSYDGLPLTGVYYELFPGAPIEIMFHGYRGSANRDLCGGVQRCYKLGRNALLVNQRGHGKSGSNVITFGIKERFDVKAWAEYAYQRFGNKVPLLITGISMGASTVLMASSLPLPPTVVGVIADCGYSSAKEIIQTVIKKMHLPVWLFYPFVKMGAMIFGKFNPEETSPKQEVANSKLPILFIHGAADDFVPCEMSKINQRACTAISGLEVFENAGHGMSYLLDPDRYIRVLTDFEKHYNPLV